MKTILPILLIAIALSACSSSNDDEQTTNPVNGTTWTFMQTTNGESSPDEYFSTDYSLDVLQQFFTDFTFTLGDTFSTITNDTIARNAITEHWTLHFNRHDCTLDTDITNTSTIRKTEHNYQTYIFAPAVLQSRGCTLTITSDGIYFKRPLVDEEGYDEKLYELTDYVMRQQLSSSTLETTTQETNTHQQTQFSYRLQDNDIYMTNTTLTWVGKLTADSEQLTIVQLLPTPQDIATLGKSTATD